MTNAKNTPTALVFIFFSPWVIFQRPLVPHLIRVLIGIPIFEASGNN